MFTVRLENNFTVPVPLDEAWAVLLDIEQIAPCMPGAALDSVTGDEFTGRVKVKLGPINMTYQGSASFVEKDEAARTAVIDARGKDQRGGGTASATVTARLAAEADGTRVEVLTDLNITGKAAQFGRGVMADVSNKLLRQFADNLAAQLARGSDAEEGRAGPAPAAAHARGGAAGSPAAGGPPPIASPASSALPAGASTEPEALDLLSLAGGSVAGRFAGPAAALVALALLVAWLVTRRR